MKLCLCANLMIARFISKRTWRKRTPTPNREKKEREQFLCTKRTYVLGLSAYAFIVQKEYRIIEYLLSTKKAYMTFSSNSILISNLGRKPLTPQQKKEIIRLWPTNSYRQISAATGIATSAVHGAVKEWLGDLDAPTAKAMRQFMAEVQKSKLKKVSELAQGYRMYNLARSMNINEVEIETFLSQLNDECIRRNIEPPELAGLLKQAIEFSSNQNVSLSEAPALIEKRGQQLDGIRKETQAAKADRTKALAENNMTDDTIKEYLDLRSTLMKYGLPATGPQTLVRTLQNVEALGHDPTRIVEAFSKIKSFQYAERQHQLNCRKWENRAKSFKSTCELASWFESIGFTPLHVEVLKDIVEYIAKTKGIPVERARDQLLVYLRMYLNRESLRREVLELENEMKVLRNSVLYDFYKRFGMTNALMLLDTIKQIVAKDYNWDANLLSRDLKDVRQWREMRKQEQERQHMTTTTASPQPAPQPSSPSTPQSQEEAVQSSPSQSDAKPSAADAEPTTHENEEHEEESQEGGGQTDAEGNKERR
jgi:hypothetical protein